MFQYPVVSILNCKMIEQPIDPKKSADSILSGKFLSFG
jgi:hypothetical protein